MLTDVPGKSGGHTRLDQSLGDKEEIGRARSGDASDGVEMPLG
jgi:hypothetical protein